MTLTASDLLIAVVLVSCVPLQYFLVQNWGSPSSSRSYYINRLITNVKQFYDEYLTLSSWFQWLFQFLNIPYHTMHGVKYVQHYGAEYDEGESPAVEVMKYKQNNGYFAMSPEPRTHRSPKIQFRVGQVVVHKRWKYRGVIIGWDESTKAPAHWITEMDAQNKEWKNMANYAILVDTRDRLTPQLTYVPQENIEVIKSMKIIHPLVENYFEHFDGAQYIPRPWLQTLYPQD